MTQYELDTIVQSGEGYKIEFKRNVNSDLSKELVAFANSSGGRIFAGIEDDGALHGVTVTNELKSKVQMMARDCDPPVVAELEVFNKVLIIHVPEGSNKPYRCTNGFYIRNGASSIKLSTSEIREFFKEEGKVHFDEMRSSAKYPKEFDDGLIKKYMDISGISSVMKSNELLSNLGVLNSEQQSPVINNTGILFFAKHPSQFIPQSMVNCVAYKGNIKVNIIDKKSFEFDLITNIDESLAFLKRHLNIAYEIKEKRRKEKLEIPEVALREAIVNAVAHRDYFEKGANVMVEVFDNRVEITNPGGLPKGLKPEDFGTRTLARNPLIAALLNRAGYIEKLGTGVQRMRKEMQNAKLPEPDFHFGSFFSIVLKRVHTPEKAISSSLNVSPRRLERMMYVLRELYKGKALNITKVAEKFKVVEKAIRKDLLLLKEKGWVIVSGTTSNRTYQLSKQAVEQLGT